MLGELDRVEEVFKKCVSVAENVKTSLNKEYDQTTNAFMWQNNLLKFYLQHDMDKAVSYAAELQEEVGHLLQVADKSDLDFSMGTSLAL